MVPEGGGRQAGYTSSPMKKPGPQWNVALQGFWCRGRVTLGVSFSPVQDNDGKIILGGLAFGEEGGPVQQVPKEA